MLNKNNLTIYNNDILPDLDYILDIISNHYTDLCNGRLNDFKYLNSGFFGDVYLYKNYAIKLFNSNDGDNDCYILSKLQDIQTYPKLFAGNDRIMISEFIDGVNLNSYEQISTICNKECLKSFFTDIKKTLNNNIMYSDLHDENIILTKEGFLKIVDVGDFFEVEDYYKAELKDNIDYIASENEVNIIKRVLDYSAQKKVFKIYDIIKEQKQQSNICNFA